MGLLTPLTTSPHTSPSSSIISVEPPTSSRCTTATRGWGLPEVRLGVFVRLGTVPRSNYPLRSPLHHLGLDVLHELRPRDHRLDRASGIDAAVYDLSGGWRPIPPDCIRLGTLGGLRILEIAFDPPSSRPVQLVFGSWSTKIRAPDVPPEPITPISADLHSISTNSHSSFTSPTTLSTSGVLRVLASEEYFLACLNSPRRSSLSAVRIASTICTSPDTRGGMRVYWTAWRDG